MKGLLFIFMAIGFVGGVAAQDINGNWEGNYGRQLMMPRPQKLVVEIYTFDDSVITGASHLYYRGNKYEHYKITGIFHRKDSTVTFREDSALAIKLGIFGDNCAGIYSLKLSVSDTLMRLTGRWKDVSRSLFHCPSSTVWLEKRLRKPDTTAPEKEPANIALPAKNPEMNRSPDIQSLIEIKKRDKDSIKIEVYDNGEVDNDTVSVYFNDDLIIDKRMISLKPILFYVNAGDFTGVDKIKLVAESLGSIPPCTAIMIITTKTKRYEVSLSSTFYKNGIVELFLKDQ
jgi:hypothetical protein